MSAFVRSACHNALTEGGDAVEHPTDDVAPKSHEDTGSAATGKKTWELLRGGVDYTFGVSEGSSEVASVGTLGPCASKDEQSKCGSVWDHGALCW